MLNPGVVHVYTWDEPLHPHQLVVSLNNHVSQKQFCLDKNKEKTWKLDHSPHMRISLFADGCTHSLCFTEIGGTVRRERTSKQVPVEDVCPQRRERNGI